MWDNIWHTRPYMSLTFLLMVLWKPRKSPHEAATSQLHEQKGLFLHKGVTSPTVTVDTIMLVSPNSLKILIEKLRHWSETVTSQLHRQRSLFLHKGVSSPTVTIDTIMVISPKSLKILIEEFRHSCQTLLELSTNLQMSLFIIGVWHDWPLERARCDASAQHCAPPWRSLCSCFFDILTSSWLSLEWNEKSEVKGLKGPMLGANLEPWDGVLSALECWVTPSCWICSLIDGILNILPLGPIPGRGTPLSFVTQVEARIYCDTFKSRVDLWFSYVVKHLWWSNPCSVQCGKLW